MTSKVLMFPTKPGINYPVKPTSQSLVTIADGQQGTVQTLAAMRKYVDQYKTSALVRETATRLVKPLAQKDYLNEAKALFNYVKNSIRYTRDIYGVETVQTPDYTLEHRIGDCDDKATLLGALLESIGFETRFHAMGKPGTGICHVIVEARNPLTGGWIPMETTMDVAMGWLPPDADKHIFYYGGGKVETINGLFSGITRSLKKIVSGGAHLTKTAVKTTVNTAKDLKKGDVKGALSNEWSGAKDELATANQLRKDIHAAIIPPILVDQENRLTDATVKALASKQGGIVLSILSIIPVTAPFALAAQGALIIAQAEAVRKALSQMNATKKSQTSQILSTVRYVYDPAIQAIRERQKTGDENLIEYKYVNGQLIQLTADELVNVNGNLTAAQKKKVLDNSIAATAKKYPDYANDLKNQLNATGVTGDSALGELGLGWTDVVSQIATQVAGSYASGKIAANFAHQQVNDQLKLMNSQLKQQAQTPAVQGVRSALTGAADSLSSFTSQNKTAIIMGAGVIIAGLLIYLSRSKGRRR